ncbi:MAG: transcription termination factor Rho [Clostridia bacterium]|nr:transcription termination factor Rho [Clostridia bacterium]
MTEFIAFSTEMLQEEGISILREIGRRVGVKQVTAYSKESLIEEIIKVQNGETKPCFSNRGAPSKPIDVSKYYKRNGSSDRFSTDEDGYVEAVGFLEKMEAGYGFLRAEGFVNSNKDVFVSEQTIKDLKLRRGDYVVGKAKRNLNSAPSLQTVSSVNGNSPEEEKNRAKFDDLIPCYPTDRLIMEDGDLSMRVVDLCAPVGMGQRGLIVAPPKAGKTTLIKRMATAIATNYPDVKPFVLLIDERPEEVTDIKRSINGEVVFSTFDECPEHHIRAAELVINRAKRLVEVGKNVVILMDSITKLARAYNAVEESSGKTLSGGIESSALYGAKKFFGTARNIENGGSLTIISTALVDTGSRMDDVIYEEFKGTGNMEIHLSRELSEKRIFPAIDIKKSGTRRDDLIVDKEELVAMGKIRKALSVCPSATESFIDLIEKTKTNAEFVSRVDGWLELIEKSGK